MATSERPSYESLVASDQAVTKSLEFLHLRWKLFVPLSSAIQVLEDATDPSSTQQPYQRDSSTFHPISNLPVTKPPVSSISVTEDRLDCWVEDWVENHIPNTDTDHAEWVEADPGGEDDDGYGDQDGRNLMSCCGERRPCPPPPIIVKASTHPFVTIHDFIAAVHPWLQAVKDDILNARGVFEDGRLPADTPMFICPCVLTPIFVYEGRDKGPEFWDAKWKKVAEPC
jgi:hypothetical protein